MPYHDLIARARSLFGPALLLEQYFPRELRAAWTRWLWVAFCLSSLLSAVAFGVGVSGPATYVPFLSVLTVVAHKFYGVTLLLFAVLFALSALEAFDRSFRFRGLTQTLSEVFSPQSGVPVSYDVATIVVHTEPGDITGGFLSSGLGQEILFRAGVRAHDYHAFLSARTTRVSVDSFVVLRDKGVTLAVYTESVLKYDEEFAGWLMSMRVTKESMRRTAEWVAENLERTRAHERWWSRDSLGRIPSIGRTWAYGETYELEKYGREVVFDAEYPDAVARINVENDEVEYMERVLARQSEADVLLIGADRKLRHERVLQLAHKIREGHVLLPLEGKRVYRIDLEALLSSFETASDAERELRACFNQAIHAGNIILELVDIAGTIARGRAIGLDVVELLIPYLASSHLQVVMEAQVDEFEHTLARDKRLMQLTEVVHMHDVDERALLLLLGERAVSLERRTGVAYTYPALEAAADLAVRMFPDATMPDKAFDILEQAVSVGLQSEDRAVYREDIESLVTRATNVPLGAPNEEERDKLRTLEERLHARVVGQDRAITLIAQALRRARAGTGTTNRPMGSFLFLGPTGVGKTETAKALAYELFGSDERMVRLDMSEFSGAHAVEELLGFTDGTPGRLGNALREHPYGVLLLDEFEKAERSVHDLFLQVLDEGFITDTAGVRLSARNLIIIATSNAGSDLVWEYTHANQDLEAHRAEFIDRLIADHVFRPELMNRFDGVVLFHPLSSAHAREIARLELQRLAERLQKRGVELQVNDALVDAVATRGYSAQFGGRALRGYVRDHVEQLVADRLLDGTAIPGSKLVLHPEDVK